MKQWQAMIEARDLSDVESLLAENVELTGSDTHQRYNGRAVMAVILRGVLEELQGLHYVREIISTDGRDCALEFEARVGDLEINGCDFLHLDDDGLIDRFKVMYRPLDAATELSRRLAVRFASTT
ncbi:nuclear transport factor 2 family protein [Streptomyces canus]|uniref:nuclear transport factor 2 family protein n=1 Tax=Streptomyces canus TaxID=58343 RepID=UPI00325352FE